VIKNRNVEFARAQSAIDMARFRVLALEIATWIETGDREHPSKDPSVKVTTAETGADQLNRRWKKLVKRGKHIDAIDPQQRHKMRIAAKKLRYATEFFADVFPGKKAARRRKRFLADLKALQTYLGDLNNITVNKRLSASLVDVDQAIVFRNRLK